MKKKLTKREKIIGIIGDLKSGRYTMHPSMKRKLDDYKGRKSRRCVLDCCPSCAKLQIARSALKIIGMIGKEIKILALHKYCQLKLKQTKP